MSFLKITDPAKRDLIVAEFLKTKKNIQQNFLNEKLGDIGLQQELTKFYKPIVDSQSTISKEQNALLSTIKENSAATSNALQALPASISSSLKAIQFPQYPAIEADEHPIEEIDVSTLNLGPIATEYFGRYTTPNLVDKTFGIYSKEGEVGKFYIGDTRIFLKDEDDITVKDKTYIGTPGLWELMTMEIPNKGLLKDKDLSDYTEILIATNAIPQPNRPNYPKSSGGYKYMNYIKPIWEANYKKQAPKKGKAKKGKAASTGEGVVVLPQDPNALVEMLSLRLASFQAGNTGVRNEIVGICEELLRQGVIDADSYKNLMLQL